MDREEAIAFLYAITPDTLAGNGNWEKGAQAAIRLLVDFAEDHGRIADALDRLATTQEEMLRRANF